MWRLKFVPGTIKVVSRKNGIEVLSKELKTAGAPAQIICRPIENRLKQTVKILAL